MSLNDLKKGQKATLLGFNNQEIESALLIFGLFPGVVVELKRKVPFGGSLYLSFNQTLLALRRSEAAQVSIEIK